LKIIFIATTITGGLLLSFFAFKLFRIGEADTGALLGYCGAVCIFVGVCAGLLLIHLL